MKTKLLLWTLLAGLPTLGYSQVFQENFDGSGPGFAAWKVINVDGLPEATPVSDIVGWVRKDRGGPTPNYGGPDGNFAAVSTSFYTPAGISNDWLISPQFTVSGASPYLRWEAKAQDADFPDGYKVMLSTTGGNTVADFNVTLLTVAAEDSEWRNRAVNLQAYNGQTVTIAFVNNSNDQFVLLVDTIRVEDFTPAALPGCATLNLPVNAATNIEYLDGVDFAWTAPAGSTVTAYDFFIDTVPNPTTPLGTTTETAVTVTGLEPSTLYYWKAVPKNDSGSATGCPAFTFTTAVSPVAPYCGPLTFDFVEPITKVSIGGLVNVTDPDLDNSPAHEIFLDQTANAVPGQTIDIELQGNTGGDYEDQFAVFIDWNQNGNFNEANEQYLITQAISNSTGTDGISVSQKLSVPAGALAGKTRMRIKKSYEDPDLMDPCASGFFGQAEEYSINVATLAVNESEKNAVKFYPNPVQDILNLDSPSKIKSVQIYDASGKTVLAREVNTAKSQLNLSSLPAGLYIVKAEMESGIKTFKFIKK